MYLDPKKHDEFKKKEAARIEVSREYRQDYVIFQSRHHERIIK